MRFDLSVMDRQTVAALLEGPVRRLLADGPTTHPIVEIEEIIAELDRRDHAEQASKAPKKTLT